MLICVCVKPVFRTDLPFRMVGPGGSIRPGDCLPAANPADQAALATAFALKTRLPEGAEVLVLSAGGASEGGASGGGTSEGGASESNPTGEAAALDEQLRAALAAGADRVARILLEPPDAPPSGSASNEPSPGGPGDATAAATWRNARGVAQALRPMAPGLILTGEKSAGSGRGCFGALLAYELGADFAHRIHSIDPSEGRWKVTARLEGGYGQEMILGKESPGRPPIPAVVTVAGPPDQLPYPSLPAWIASRTATIPEIRVAPTSEISGSQGGESTLRVPMPRVGSHWVPEDGLSAEERIGAMIGQQTGAGAAGGGAVVTGGSPQEQAEAALALLKARGMVD